MRLYHRRVDLRFIVVPLIGILTLSGGCIQILGLDDFVALTQQHTSQKPADVVFIIDDQNRLLICRARTLRKFLNLGVKRRIKVARVDFSSCSLGRSTLGRARVNGQVMDVHVRDG